MAMNLGSANLKYVNSSRPQLLHTNSQRSISAQDDYYSLPSENASEADSADDQTTVIRYKTPPEGGSAYPVPPRDATTPKPQSPQQLISNQPSAAPRDGAGLPFQRLHEPTAPQEYSQPEPTGHHLANSAPVAEPEEAAATVAAVKKEHRISRKAVPQTTMKPETSPTPGVDDTPYIQFAIDQLTRDEELLGRSRDPSGSPELAPVSPISSTGSFSRGFADRQARFAERQRPGHAVAVPSPSVSPLSAEGVAGERGVGLVPAQPPRDSYRYPPLNYIPTSLRLPAILALILACLGLIGLTVLAMVWAAKNDGLWNYDGVGTGKYFLAEYLPQILAVVVLIWLHIVMAAVQRILPFVLLASSGNNAGVKKSKGNRAGPDDIGSTSGKDIGTEIFHTVPLYYTNHLLPNTSLLRKGELGLSFASITVWLAHFSVPLASGFFQTRLYNSSTTGAWKWTTVQPVGVLLVAIYTGLIFALIGLHLRFRRKPTGLKWDPVSLADILVLLRRSSGLATPRDSMAVTQQQRASIGYWEEPGRPGAIFHGIGAERAATGLQQGRQPIQNASTFESWATNANSRNKRTSAKSHPSYLRSSRLILYAVIATALLIAFLAATYVHSALATGFTPLVPSTTFVVPTAFASFSPSNFLYSFVPSLLGMLVPLLWEPIDAAVRYLAPYYSLATAGPSGIAAEHSLLLGYAADSAPFVSAIRSRGHGHMIVTLSGIFAAFGWAVPVLAGGVFTAQFVQSKGGIVIRADPAGLTGLTVFVVISALGWVIAWPIEACLMGSRRGGAQKPRAADKATRNRGLFSSNRRRQARPTSATTPMVGGTHQALQERDLEKGDPSSELHQQRYLDPPPPIHDPTSSAYHQTPGTPDETPGTPASVPYGRVRSNTPPLDDGDDDDEVDLGDGYHHFLGGADVRYLAGVVEAVGTGVLGLRVWREPRSRTDLVGRLIGRGRGRWSWDGKTAGAATGGAANRRSGISRVDV